MKKFLFPILLANCFCVAAQPVVTENSVLVKPYFNPGESKVYKIKMEAKTEDPPYVFSRAEQEYEVSFTVLDTVGGYTFLYKCRTVKATDKKWIEETLAAQVSNNIEVVYKMSKDGKLIVYENIQKVQKQLATALDSIKKHNQFSPHDSTAIEQFYRNLNTINGVGICLQPIRLFNDIFDTPTFRRGYDYTPGFRFNLFMQPDITGVVITSLKQIDRSRNTAQLKTKFIGNADSAAKRMNLVFLEQYKGLNGKAYKGYLPSEIKNNDETEYEVELSSGCVVLMKRKSLVRYFARTVFKISMGLVSSY